MRRRTFCGRADSARFELHQGFVVAFAGGTLDHDRISLNMRNALDHFFPAPWRSFGSDMKVRVGAATFFYPDAGVVCDELPGSASIVERPRIVVEVLSPSTRSYDLIEKRAAYREVAGLEAYVIVHTATRLLELEIRDVDGGWLTVTCTDDGVPLGIGILTLDDVYRRSSLEST